MDKLSNARSKNDFKDMAYWPQIFASVIVSLIFFNHAALTGYATEALPQLRNETNLDVNLDEYEGSMFAAILWMIGIIGEIYVPKVKIMYCNDELSWSMS